MKSRYLSYVKQVLTYNKNRSLCFEENWLSFILIKPLKNRFRNFFYSFCVTAFLAPPHSSGVWEQSCRRMAAVSSSQEQGLQGSGQDIFLWEQLVARCSLSQVLGLNLTIVYWFAWVHSAPHLCVSHVPGFLQWCLYRYTLCNKSTHSRRYCRMSLVVFLPHVLSTRLT